MRMTAISARRHLYGAIAAGALAAAASGTIAVPTAGAAPGDCTASGVASTVNSVSASIGDYLEMHPDTNEALSNISKQPTAQANASYRTYFATNPQVANDLRTLQRPLADMNSQCGVQVEPSQVVTGFSDALNLEGPSGPLTQQPALTQQPGQTPEGAL